MIDPLEQLEQVIATTLQRHPRGPWDRQRFSNIKELEIDSRGKVGELWLGRCLEALGHTIEITGKKDPRRKHFDLLIDQEVRLEVKTATQSVLGRTKLSSWQHEGLNRSHDNEGVALIDVAPNAIFLTFAAHSLMPWTDPNDNYPAKPKRMTRRESGVWKWDLKPEDVSDRKVETLQDVGRLFQQFTQDLRSLM